MYVLLSSTTHQPKVGAFQLHTKSYDAFSRGLQVALLPVNSSKYAAESLIALDDAGALAAAERMVAGKEAQPLALSATQVNPAFADAGAAIGRQMLACGSTELTDADGIKGTGIMPSQLCSDCITFA